MLTIKKTLSALCALSLLALASCATTPVPQNAAHDQFEKNVPDQVRDKFTKAQEISKIFQIVEVIKQKYIVEVNEEKLNIACLDRIYPGHPPYQEVLALKDAHTQPSPDKDDSKFRFYLAVAAYTNAVTSTPAQANNISTNCLKAMTASLDKQSEFFSAEDMADLKAPLGTNGIGVELATSETPDKNRVIQALHGGPAYAAGIQPGDMIISIDGMKVKDLPGREVIKLLRGESGTLVSLEVQRKPADPLIKLDIVRKKVVRYNIVESKLIAPDYGYIRIQSLGEAVSKDLADELQKLYATNKNDLRGFILDLRLNSGGLLNQASGVVAPFVPEDSLVAEIKGRDAESNFKLTTHPDHYFRWRKQTNDYTRTYLAAYKQVPMVVLINKETASGAEMIAAALHGHKRAIVVGQSSYGNNRIQTYYPISSSEESLKITTAQWFTPTGQSLDGTGITPDIVTEETKITDIGTDHDSTLGKALDALKQTGRK